MTQLQQKALELVDELLTSVHNKLLNITDDAEIREVATKGFELGKEIYEIQIWCRIISSDPQSKNK